ncbi:MAG TPA: ankyrin repeat domain-containing protein, partial [Burkholderiaceae bacterium]|nr:ankyrin repeat domain-containing protein [Burkholderiaceae bacterium]
PQNARLASTDRSLVDARSAALWGDATKLQALLGQNPELLTMRFGNNHDTLLTTAADAGECGSVQAVLTHALLNQSADFAAILNHRNADQETALMLAIRAGAIDVAAALMKHGSIEVNRPNRSGQTPLHLAAAQAAPGFAAGLLNLVSIDPNPRDGEGNTPLHVAVEQGRSEIAILLVSHPKTAPDEVNHAGQSPLSLAIDAKNLPVFDALMRRQGVDPDRSNESHQTLLWQQVLDWNNNLSLGGSVPAVQPWSYILGRLAASPGVNSNQRGWEGETPLTYLCKLSCPWHIGAHAEFNAWRNNAVKAMLEGSRLGAGRLDPGAANAEGKTPYQLALATGNTGLLAVLDADAYARAQRH